MALNNGLWAVLFLALFIYQLRDSKLREQKYQKTISDLSETLLKVEDIDQNVCILSNNLNDVNASVMRIENNVQNLIKENTEDEEVQNNRLLG